MATPHDTRPLLPIWLHTTVSFLAQLIGFFVGPVLLTLLTARYHLNLGRFIVFPLFGSAVVGVLTAGALVDRNLPARCPVCGGRAYASGMNRRRHYICRDCGHLQY